MTRVLVLGLLLLVGLAGCSAVPYAPGPSFEPSPTTTGTGPAGTSAAPSGTSAVIRLAGQLVSADGQRADVRTEVTLAFASGRLLGDGTVTLINPSDRIDAGAGSVYVTVQAGYRLGSRACNALPPPEGERWRGYCWLAIGAASPLGTYSSLTALQPGEQRVISLGHEGYDDAPISVRDAEAAQLRAQLSRPAAVVAIAHPVNGTSGYSVGECTSGRSPVVPSGPSGAPGRSASAPGESDLALVGATASLACDQLVYLGP